MSRAYTLSAKLWKSRHAPLALGSPDATSCFNRQMAAFVEINDGLYRYSNRYDAASPREYACNGQPTRSLRRCLAWYLCTNAAVS